MNEHITFVTIEPKIATVVPKAAQITSGIPIPPVRLLQIMSPDDWEQFTHEWLSFHKTNGTYQSISAASGSGDLGLDVVAFTSTEGFSKPWDSYQCKHYNHALRPTDVYGEIGKIIYHSFNRKPPYNQTCRVPRKHFFIAPHGVGIKLSRLLKDPTRFKDDVREKWNSNCLPAIGRAIKGPITGAFSEYFDAFDFSIFDEKNAITMIEEHSKTLFYATRFGGSLPLRSEVGPPPANPTAAESHYLKQLLDAYGDHLRKPLANRQQLEPHPQIGAHYDRQRINFYSAEELRNYARETTPPRTFKSLQDDIYNGVIDICEASHDDGLARLRNTLTAAGQLNMSGNALVGVTTIADKQGICHQLANESLLTWVQQPCLK